MSNDTDRDRLSGIQQRPGGSAAAGAEATLGGPRSPPVDMELSPTAKPNNTLACSATKHHKHYYYHHFMRPRCCVPSSMIRRF
jgi:hypothetical protein